MFLGGANHEATRIRASSIKGAICFWWRALVFSRLVADCGGDQLRARRELKQRERMLFGGPKGQSSVLISVSQADLRTIRSEAYLGRNGEQINAPPRRPHREAWEANQAAGAGSRYLGYGVIGAFGQTESRLQRACIRLGQEFRVQLVFRPNIGAEKIKQVVDAVKLFGLLGGMGTRVRRGYGSVALARLEGDAVSHCTAWVPPEDTDQFKASLINVLDRHSDRSVCGSQWPITAFARETECFTTNRSCHNAYDIHNDIGTAIQQFRAWGFDPAHGGAPLVNGLPSLKNFKDDHDWYREAVFRTTYPDFVPERTAFGLPHRYSDTWAVNGTGDIERRASPLMIHIHQPGEGKNAFGVLSLFPTQFLPTGQVDANGSKAYDFARRGVPVLTSFLTGTPPDRVVADGTTKAFSGSFASGLTKVLP